MFTVLHPLCGRSSMTSVAPSDHLVLRVVARVTSKFLVMNLQSLHVATRLTAPVVSLETLWQ